MSFVEVKQKKKKEILETIHLNKKNLLTTEPMKYGLKFSVSV